MFPPFSPLGLCVWRYSRTQQTLSSNARIFAGQSAAALGDPVSVRLEPNSGGSEGALWTSPSSISTSPSISPVSLLTAATVATSERVFPTTNSRLCFFNTPAVDSIGDARSSRNNSRQKAASHLASAVPGPFSPNRCTSHSSSHSSLRGK